MTAIGDKQIVMTQTLLLRDDEIGKIEVPLGSKNLVVAIRFLSTEQTEPAADWYYTDGTLSIDCTGWNTNTTGGAMVKPHRIGEIGGKPIGFNFAHHRAGSINYVTLQFYLGGTYE